ncbi:DUF262 domain-containing protein [Lonsdalea quercina]|uniref:DUF262 domain-containing protein n=1 Tax=Lonsdalea quercina TaxID=71657 RepID=UPI0039762616
MSEEKTLGNENLDIEEENDEVDFVEFDISVSPADPTLELLVNQLNREDIIVPFYQRRYVWKIEQASRLIESFLMGLPVPQIFLYVNDDDQLEVIDGQQRILSVKYFMEGYFGEIDSKGRRQLFRLKGLSERSSYNGKTFSELPSKDQRKLRNSTLRAIHIKQLLPSKRNDSVFHIFERLNTGGTQLKPQEIRNAVYRGDIVKELQALNANESWQTILGLKAPDKNQKDVELVLRIFSLYRNWESYEKPMLKFLNNEMDENKSFNNKRAEEFKERFIYIVDQISRCIDKPFRPKGVINSSSLEAVFISLMELDDISDIDVSERYRAVINDNHFRSLISGPTTDTVILKSRIRRAKEIFELGYNPDEDGSEDENA